MTAFDQDLGNNGAQDRILGDWIEASAQYWRQFNTALNNDTVLGQSEETLGKIARGLQKANGKTPASFLITDNGGGTGKTFTAKTTAALLGRKLFIVDSAECRDTFETRSKLLGLSRGFEGSSNGGALTNALREYPDRVILFDEIDKADESLFPIIFDLVAKGALTDACGRPVGAGCSIVILSAGPGTLERVSKALNKIYESQKFNGDGVHEKPDFLFDLEMYLAGSEQNTVLELQPLDRSALKALAQRETRSFSGTTTRLAGLSVSLSDDATEQIVGTDPLCQNPRGVLTRFFLSVKDPVARHLLSDNKQPGTLHFENLTDPPKFTPKN